MLCLEKFRFVYKEIQINFYAKKIQIASKEDANQFLF